jgi:hypothetical protein
MPERVRHVRNAFGVKILNQQDFCDWLSIVHFPFSISSICQISPRGKWKMNDGKWKMLFVLSRLPLRFYQVTSAVQAVFSAT